MRAHPAALLLVAALLGHTAATAEAARITKSRIGLNTVDTVELSIQFVLSEPIDRETSDDSSGVAEWRIRTDQNVLQAGHTVGFSKTAVRFLVEHPDPDFIEALVNNDGTIYLELDQPVTVYLASGDTYDLEPETAERLSRETGPLSRRQQQLIEETALGAYLLNADVLDLAREVGEEDMTPAEYAVSYAFTRPLFLIPESLRSTLPILWRTEGRISTDSRNPLNYLSFALAARSNFTSFRVLTAPFSLRGLVETSLAGTQRMDTTAVSILAGVEGLIPNLIDLSGRSSRLRPHPEIRLSGGYALHPQDQPLFNHEDGSWEVTGALNYYIPVLDKYAIIYEGSLHYADNARSGEKLRAWNAVTLSYDLPLEDLNALVKWESGRSPWVFEEGERLLVGVVLDYLPF